MQEFSSLSSILWERIFKLRRASCIGCICNQQNSTIHEICLTNIWHNFFHSEAVRSLFEDKIITNNEKQFLMNVQSAIQQ